MISTTTIDNHETQSIPEHFLWGAAEGIFTNSVAADRDVDQEISVLSSLGLNAYRLSVDWARVEPRPGAWDMTYLAMKRAHLLALRSAGIEPIVTLHRGLDPLWFVADNGWLRGDAVQLFCRYVVKIVEELGDLVIFYVTVDGPVRLATGDLRPGGHAAPGGKASAPFPFSVWATWRTVRALLHAHGAARRTLYEAQPHHGPRPPGAPRVGLAHHISMVLPRHAGSPLDRAAAASLDYTQNWLPLRVLADGRLHAPLGHGQLLLELRDSQDFIGITIARGLVVDAAPGHHNSGQLSPPSDVGAHHLAALLRRVAPFARPILITADNPGDSADEHRADFLRQRVSTLSTAIQHGISVGGYLYAPLFDPGSPADALGTGLAVRTGPGEPLHVRPSALAFAREVQCTQNWTLICYARHALHYSLPGG